MNNTRVLVPLCTFAIFGILFLLVAATIILALIPIYLGARAVPSSTSPTQKVYTVSNVVYTAQTIGTRKARTIRATDTYIQPTGDTISSCQTELTKIFNVIQARVVISDALVTSQSGKLIMLLQIKLYFIYPCDNCEDRQKRLISQVLYGGEVVLVDLQYYSNGCTSSAVKQGFQKMTLSTAGSNNYAVSSPIPTPVTSIIQKTDACLAATTTTTIATTATTTTTTTTTTTDEGSGSGSGQGEPN